MRQQNKGFCMKIDGLSRIIGSAFTLVLVLTLEISTAIAFEIDTGSEDWKVRWDNTLKYSAAFRVQDRSESLLDDINTDDGDRNFDVGPTSNRLDLFSEMDITYRNFGARLSAAVWFDQIYDTDNDNDSPGTSNSFSVAHDKFTDDTRDLMGRKAELLDAFIFGKGDLGSVPASFRLGRHTLLWGESLFFATNGISYGQAPLDLIKLLGVPSTQAKELFMPVNQFSGQLQLLDQLSIMTFAQFESRETRIPPAGSYFNAMDIVDEGGERLLLGPNPGAALFRGDDMDADNLGTWGLATRYRPTNLDVELGLYYSQFHDRMPQVYLQPGLTPTGMLIDPSVLDLAHGKVGEYYLVYPENVQLIGASFSTQVGDISLGGEMSGRFNTPLVSTPQTVLPGMKADNDDNPLYAVGDTLHANLSAIYALRTTSFWQGGSIFAEAGWNYLADTTDNDAALDPTRDRYAYGFRTLFEPAYYQVLSGVDITVPIGLGFNPKGNSSVDPIFNGGGADNGGDWNVGIKVTYLQAWKLGLTYTSYFGDEDTQELADRDFISLYIQRTF
jgi:Protein of unknown function (DUF1302)